MLGEYRAQLVVLILAVIIIFVVTLALLLLATLGGPPSSDLLPSCGAGECVVNFLTGAKDCTRSEYNVSREFCASATLCDDFRSKCAIQPDGSSNCDSVCAPGTECGCIQTLRCSREIRATFSQDPNPITNNETWRQQAFSTDLASQYQVAPPLVAGYPEQPVACMLDASTLSKADVNRCLLGTLVQYPSGNNPLYGCANAPVCSNGQHPVSDGTSINCQTVSNWPNWEP
jgi:hypothetical protein